MILSFSGNILLTILEVPLRHLIIDPPTKAPEVVCLILSSGMSFLGTYKRTLLKLHFSNLNFLSPIFGNWFYGLII